MTVSLQPVDASNWRAMIALQVNKNQETFVASPLKSLAMCYARGWGDQYDYLPFVIRDDERGVVGYVTLVCDPRSSDDYWIDDIMIDASHQGKGYGRQALDLVLRFMTARYQRCGTIRLSCFRGNTNAAALYESVGFVKTGRSTAEFGEPEYALSDQALSKFRN
jgi:diamine N-acetyltransferase